MAKGGQITYAGYTPSELLGTDLPEHDMSRSIPRYQSEDQYADRRSRKGDHFVFTFRIYVVVNVLGKSVVVWITFRRGSVGRVDREGKVEVGGTRSTSAACLA